jgi:hypothetical protein
MKKYIITAFISALVFAGCYYDNVEEIYPGAGLFTVCDTTANITYSGHIRPLMENYCFSCHSGASPTSGYALDSYEALAPYAATGELEGNVFHSPGFNPMPPSFQLDSCLMNQFHNWIANGYPNN